MVGPPSSWSLRDQEDELRGRSIGLATWPFRCRGTFTPLSPTTQSAAHSVALCLKPAIDTQAESSAFSLLATSVTVQRRVRFLERVAAVWEATCSSRSLLPCSRYGPRRDRFVSRWRSRPRPPAR